MRQEALLTTRPLETDRRPNSRRWEGRLSVGLLLLVSSLLARSANASWVYPGATAYALVNVANGSATIDQNNSNNVGGENWSPIYDSVQYYSLGVYGVTFPAMWTPDLANLGTVQVTPVGSNSRCLVWGWYQGNAEPGLTDENGNPIDDLVVQIGCYAPSGAAQDTSFTVSWVERSAVDPESINTQEGGYAWVFDQTTSSYDTDSAWSWNSTGQPITVTHAGTGIYQVLFGGQYGAFGWTDPVCSAYPQDNGGTVAVSAYGGGNGGNDYCTSDGWGFSGPEGLTVWVQCWNGSTGAPDDSQFDVTFSTMSIFGGMNSAAFAWADQPSTSSYVPDPGYTADITYKAEGTPCPHYEDTNGSTDVMTITRSSTGSYSVFFPDSYEVPSVFHSVAYGGSGNYCTKAPDPI